VSITASKVGSSCIGPRAVALLLLTAVVAFSACIVPWPNEKLPVEIFELITCYLSRREIRDLRLVCREFEAKVSAQYFRNVVVPFRSELYGRLSRDDNLPLRNPAASLFSNGMRIFQSFGPHILRRRLSA
jgi:hypothetical protein